MKNLLSSSLLALAVGGLAVASFASAQTSTTPAPAAPAATTLAPKAGPGAVDPGHPRVNQVNRRETRQQQRIANGVKNDKMTPQQTANVEQREANVERTEKKDMSEHNGHLTKNEQKNLNHRENKIGKTIRNDKHPRK
jgi:small-conductance mechanosensitive channel